MCAGAGAARVRVGARARAHRSPGWGSPRVNEPCRHMALSFCFIVCRVTPCRVLSRKRAHARLPSIQLSTSLFGTRAHLCTPRSTPTGGLCAAVGRAHCPLPGPCQAVPRRTRTRAARGLGHARNEALERAVCSLHGSAAVAIGGALERPQCSLCGHSTRLCGCSHRRCLRARSARERGREPSQFSKVIDCRLMGSACTSVARKWCRGVITGAGGRPRAQGRACAAH